MVHYRRSRNYAFANGYTLVFCCVCVKRVGGYVNLCAFQTKRVICVKKSCRRGRRDCVKAGRPSWSQSHKHCPPFLSALGIFEVQETITVCTLAPWKAEQPKAMHWAVWSIMTRPCENWGECKREGKEKAGEIRSWAETGEKQGTLWRKVKARDRQAEISCKWCGRDCRNKMLQCYLIINLSQSCTDAQPQKEILVLFLITSTNSTVLHVAHQAY